MLNIGNTCRTGNTTDIPNVQYHARPGGRGVFSTQQSFGNCQQKSQLNAICDML